MLSNNKKKQYSKVLTLIALVNLVAPGVSPVTAYAQEGETGTEETVVKPAADSIPEAGTAEGESTSDTVAEESVVESEELPEPQVFNAEGIATQNVENFALSLMHMNDTHARVPSYANMLTAVKEFRSENPDSLLLHAGDVFSGTLYFNEYEGRADQALLNLFDIDVMVFGNHEFDLGGSANGHQSLANFVQGSNFPFLGANVDFSNDALMSPFETNASSVTNPRDGEIYNSIVTEVNGEQVGIFGLVTEDTVAIASPMSITFSNYISAANTAVADLEAAGVDKIIALTHLGYNTAPRVGNDILLAQNVEGIDIIVGGHSHTSLVEPDIINPDSEAPTVIVQAGENAENLGTLQVEFDANGQIIADSVTGELVSVGGLEPDPYALSVLEEFQSHVEAIENEDTGAVAVKDLENPRHGDGDEVSVRANETPLGNLVTDAMLFKAREKFPEIVAAVQNGGGIRAPISAGPITTGEVISVLPFGNNPVIAELSGQELKDIFEWAVREAPAENGGFLHISGMKLFYDSQRAPFDRVVGMYIVQENNELVEVDLEEMYLITTNGFTGQGGDGFETFATAFAEGRVRDIGEIDWEQLRDYLVEEEYLNGTVDPVLEGRITDLLGNPLPPQNEAEERQALLDRLTALEERINQLEAENKAQAEEITRLRNDLTAAEENLVAANETIAALEVRVAELESAETTTEPGAPAEPGTSTPAPGDDETAEESAADEEEANEQSNEELPQAGSSIIVPLISGSAMILSGLGVEFYRRKKL